jgi:hypothetical protein
MPSICLTTDSSPIGHGLPNGDVITEEQLSKMLKINQGPISVSRGPNGTYRSIDHTKYRIQLNLNEADFIIISAMDYYQDRPDIVFELEIQGYLPHTGNQEDRAKIANMLRAGILLGKGPTWWYAFGPISTKYIQEICIKTPSGDYLPGETVDEFIEGRKRTNQW